MEINLNFEQREKVEKNQGLVHHIAKKITIPYNSEYEDIVSIGTCGLIKAVASFDPNKNVGFANYALRCITNEIFMYLRKNKNKCEILHLDAELTRDIDGNILLLSDITADKSTKDIEGQIINNELISKIIEVILNCLSTRDKLILLYEMSDIPQTCIAEFLGICQPYSSRLVKKNIKTVKKYIDLNTKYERFFKVKLIDDKFNIQFLLSDVDVFKQGFENLLVGIRNSLKLSVFNLTCVNGMVSIYLPVEKDSFMSIAGIIKEIEGQIYKKDINEVVRSYKKAKEIKFSKHVKRINPNSKGGRIREYMFKHSTFTITELKKEFSNVSGITINRAIQDEKEKGRIKSIDGEEYSVVFIENLIVDNGIRI